MLDNQFIQGTPEWIALRKTKITATDAAVIMKESPWKTPLQLYNEKKCPDTPNKSNSHMQRGVELEPYAREFFTMKTGIRLIPKEDSKNVVISQENDWMMASFDGISECGNVTLEIKCPNIDSIQHEMARDKKMAADYMPQNQHQICVKNPKVHFFLVFDGIDGSFFEVKKDQDYIDRMMKEERKFYEMMMSGIPPEPEERDYIDRNDEIWQRSATRWIQLCNESERIEKEKEEIREYIIMLTEGKNSRGAGLSISQVSRKGAVDYSKVPILKGVNLDPYRKPSLSSWRFTCQ